MCKLTLLLIQIRYISASSGKTSFTFHVLSQICGTEMETYDNTIELSNIVVIQNDESIQEIWDVARLIKCNWVETFVKKIRFNSFSVGMLNAEEIEFSGGDTLDCWMDIQLGAYPETKEINSIVPIGETLSLLIYLKDKEENYDVAVKDCYAYSSPADEVESQKILLTNENGCVVKEKLISKFQKVRENDVDGSVLVSHATLSAFKFPDFMEVYISCNMEICKEECEETCLSEPTESPRSGSTLFGEPVYTEEPIRCFHGSTDPSCLEEATPIPKINKCFHGSSDPSCSFPRSPEPSNQYVHECTPGSDKPECLKIIDCNVNPLNPDCLKLVTKSESRCKPGSVDPKCRGHNKLPLRCIPGSKESRCQRVFDTTEECEFGSDPKCKNPVNSSPPICFPDSNDSRCRKQSTKLPTGCYPGTLDPRCERQRPKCYPGSNDPRCSEALQSGPQNDIICTPGSKNPKCRGKFKESASLKCSEGSTNPKCFKRKERPDKCPPGSKDSRCFKNASKVKDLCPPGSKNPLCLTTAQPERGSTLFPVIQTTKKSGGVFPNNFKATTKNIDLRKPSPSLKTETSNAVRDQIKLNEKKVKGNPEASKEEWKGEARYHAFHTFHYDKGDGRRRKVKFSSSTKLKRSRRNTQNTDYKTVQVLNMSRRILVAPITDSYFRVRTRRSENKIGNEIDEQDYINIISSLDNSVCLSITLFTVISIVLFCVLFVGAALTIFYTITAKK